MEEYKNLFYVREKALAEAKLNNNYKESIRIYEEHTIYKPAEHPNTPVILKKIRSAYKGNTIEYLNNLYFKFLQKIQQADKANNINELLFNSQISLGLIEPLIYYNYKHYNSFDIKTIPAIDKGLIYFSVNGIIGQLKNIADIVEFFPELKFYKFHVDLAFKRAKLSSKIYNQIKNNGDCQQSKLKNKLELSDGRFIATTINYMIKAKKLDKYKIGKETFIKIE
ncbi:hypothetical protein FF125_14370 [Aureibaculum algae]|uniref:Uncharacterized protein n=1 Tax=Aureibaculum algae TaxID=2584122 RepID=A0A5B7TXK1_9FLAO|nr:hypothetical protein [Aureibaculum algae]QCX39567.1 hypothetical protein FF125_14370 [Aureibaculum algae]